MRARTAGLHARFGRLPAPGSAPAPAPAPTPALAFAIMGCSDLPLDPERQPTEAKLKAEVATPTTAPVAMGSASRAFQLFNRWAEGGSVTRHRLAATILAAHSYACSMFRVIHPASASAG